MTLDSWVEANCPELKEGIEVHLEVLAGDDCDKEGLLRMIMISIRQFMENK